MQKEGSYHTVSFSFLCVTVVSIELNNTHYHKREVVHEIIHLNVTLCFVCTCSWHREFCEDKSVIFLVNCYVLFLYTICTFVTT